MRNGWTVYNHDEHLLIIIIKNEPAIQGWERVRTFYQSNDRNHTLTKILRVKNYKQLHARTKKSCVKFTRNCG